MNISGKEPPQYGNLEFWINKPPVSLQAKSSRKNELKKHISTIIENAEYYLSGDVKIGIEWHVHEQKRYETDTSADTDNIIKPLLDALCGPSGILIDDNQVQSITCSWVDSYQYQCEKIHITVDFFDDEFIKKDGLIFINIENSLCLPFNDNNDTKVKRIILESWTKMFEVKNQLLSNDLSYYDAKGVMPIQRVFHKSRLNGYKIVPIKEKIEEVET